MRHLHVSLLLLLLVSARIGCAAHDATFLFWNVENLFDCSHDTLRRDYEFLPDGSHHWTPWRYWRKLDSLSRTLAAVAEEDGGWPVAVGMAEVENDSVLRDLCRRSPLRMAGYEYVHSEGPDERGIDCALLYQPLRFRLLHTTAHRIDTHGRFRPTRDILCVTGILDGRDTLHLLVVHLPSRAGGASASTRHRREAVRVLRHVVDSLGASKILVMGDFNSGPRDALFRRLCPPLVSLMPQRRRDLRRAVGTYVFQRQWSFLDHMLVSPSLSGMVVGSRAEPVRLQMLLDENGFPFRTYQGPIYRGGVSDHLPLRLRLANNNPE